MPPSRRDDAGQPKRLGHPYTMGKRRLLASGAMDADGVATQAASRTYSSGTYVKGMLFR
jgi:hypothetical protein